MRVLHGCAVTIPCLPFCRTTKRSKGIALVQFVEAGDAVAAHAALDRAIFQGRLLHILPAQRPPPAAEPKVGCPL